jgi:eukaryotic-like serine/threonine-protein kinase
VPDTPPARRKRVPAYRRRMMIALAVVIMAGFVLGVLLPAS